MTTQSWTVCQVFSNQAHQVQEDVHRLGFQTYVPMMRAKRQVDGQLTDTARPAMPGYLFVWGANGSFYSRDGRSMIARAIGRMSEAEYRRIVADNSAGRHDEIAVGNERPAVRRARKPRPSKRVRRRLRAARVHTPTP